MPGRKASCMAYYLLVVRTLSRVPCYRADEPSETPFLLCLQWITSSTHPLAIPHVCDAPMHMPTLATTHKNLLEAFW